MTRKDEVVRQENEEIKPRIARSTRNGRSRTFWSTSILIHILHSVYSVQSVVKPISTSVIRERDSGFDL
jgi:hypothetical protein